MFRVSKYLEQWNPIHTCGFHSHGLNPALLKPVSEFLISTVKVSKNRMDSGSRSANPNRIASFSKGLPHNQLGEVDLSAYNALVGALNSGAASDFEAIPLGGRYWHAMKLWRGPFHVGEDLWTTMSTHVTLLAPDVGRPATDFLQPCC